MGLIIGLLVGFLADKFKIVPLMVMAYGIRGAGLLLMPFVAKLRFFLFLCTLCLNVGNAVTNVVAISLLNKNLTKEVREIMNGLAQSFKSIGKRISK